MLQARVGVSDVTIISIVEMRVQTDEIIYLPGLPFPAAWHGGRRDRWVPVPAVPMSVAGRAGAVRGPMQAKHVGGPRGQGI